MSAETLPRSPRFTVAITGASGAIYAARTVAALLDQGCELDLVVSDYGRRLLRDELGEEAALERLMPYLEQKYGPGVRRGQFNVLSNRDLGATIASGSRPTRGMVIVPCSMKSLAGVANGLSRNLVERAADVMLKEKKPLALVFRETPLNQIHIENLSRLSRAGAIIIPAAPGFYHKPKNIEELVDGMIGRVLKEIGIENDLEKEWIGK